MNNQAPVGTTLALLERNMKVMSAVQARLHASMRKEFDILSGYVLKTLQNLHIHTKQMKKKQIKVQRL